MIDPVSLSAIARTGARPITPREFAAGVIPSGPFVWDAATASRIPAFGRATSIYAGLIKQCPMDAFRGVEPLERPRLLERPDTTAARSWFVGVSVEDYLWHGNVITRIIERNAEGWPAQVQWIPAGKTSITWDAGEPVRYWYGGRELPRDDIIHVRRSADRNLPVRGVGVVEQYLSTFDRAGLEDEYERTSLARGSAPSYAVTTNSPATSETEADDAAAKLIEKFGNANREPIVLPLGTKIEPLGWSPTDAQMVEARKMTLVDVANAFNLDGYWLGAEMRGLTYRSPGPLYLSLLRTSLEPVMVDFEQTWSDGWLPRGQTVRFDRLMLTRDDFATMIETLAKAVAPPQSDPTIGGLMTVDEARLYVGWSAIAAGAPTTTSPIDTTEPETEDVA